MIRILFFAVVFMLLNTLSLHAALDNACFLERATLTLSGSSEPFRVRVSDRDDLFFADNKGTLLGALPLDNPRRDRIAYTISSPSGLKISASQAKALSDGDPKTAFRLPIEARSQDVVLLLDFKQTITAGELLSELSVAPDPWNMKLEIATSSGAFVPVDRGGLSSFDFRYLRITLPRLSLQSRPTEIIDFRFERPSPMEFVLSAHSGALYAYRGFTCLGSDFTALVTERESARLALRVDPRREMPLAIATFEKNLSYRYDTDRDGIVDSEDNCPTTLNANQSDRNRDGRGDACTDDDSDGIVGDTDNCPTLKNSDQKDSDANGVGDACQFDTDNDTIVDGADNCPRVANLDQVDTDKDGIGDVCDNCSLSNSDQSDLNKNGKGDVCDRAEEDAKKKDSDGDRIIDGGDNCPNVKNPDQKDADRDGVGDVCDNCASIQNADQEDQDGNKVGDKCEDTDRDTIV